MNREVEFRGYDEISGLWRYGSLLVDGWLTYICQIIQGEIVKWCVNPESVCQFTGLRDKHGRKIYEGDVVRRKDSAYGMEDTGVVKFDCSLGAFVLESENRGRTYRAVFKKGFSDNDGKCTIEGTYTYEVVGNIHEK